MLISVNKKPNTLSVGFLCGNNLVDNLLISC